jgi:hypothetical protein
MSEACAVATMIEEATIIARRRMLETTCLLTRTSGFLVRARSAVGSECLFVRQIEQLCAPIDPKRNLFYSVLW